MRTWMTALMVATPLLAPWAMDTAAAKSRIESDMSSIITPALVAEVEAANAKHAGLDVAGIKELDSKWRAEVTASSRPMIDEVLNKATSQHLKSKVEASNGFYTEIFVMDNKGLNVAQSDVTSDYWQGDEAKFTESYGKNASFVDEVELDESTQTYQVQISMPVKNAAGALIGAVTFGVQAK